MGDSKKKCPRENWCVCQWAFTGYIGNSLACLKKRCCEGEKKCTPLPIDLMNKTNTTNTTNTMNSTALYTALRKRHSRRSTGGMKGMKGMKMIEKMGGHVDT